MDTAVLIGLRTRCPRALEIGIHVETVLVFVDPATFASVFNEEIGDRSCVGISQALPRDVPVIVGHIVSTIAVKSSFQV